MLKTRIDGESGDCLDVAAILAGNAHIGDGDLIDVIATCDERVVARNGDAGADRLGGVIVVGYGHADAAGVKALSLADGGGKASSYDRDGADTDDRDDLGRRLCYSVFGIAYGEQLFTGVYIGDADGKALVDDLLSAVSVQSRDLDPILVVCLVNADGGVEGIDDDTVQLGGDVRYQDRIGELAVFYGEADDAVLNVGVKAIGVMSVSALEQDTGGFTVVINGIDRQSADVDLLARGDRDRNAGCNY